MKAEEESEEIVVYNGSHVFDLLRYLDRQFHQL